MFPSQRAVRLQVSDLGVAFDAQIAGRLQASAVTVRTHVSAILRKLHVKDRAETVELLASR